MLDVSVVVPARNAGELLSECLRSIQAERPREVIVVDGNSTDRTVEIARAHGATVLCDDGRGLPYARMLGARAAVSETVALIDADVVVPPGALRALYDDFSERDYAALQAGLNSASTGPGYWGRALAFHQRIGLVRGMFGVSASLIRREVLLETGFDDRFASGEDIDIRHRLTEAGHRIGVSDRAWVTHRFPDGWAFAKGQWLADGAGLARMVRVHGLDHAWQLAVPLAAAVRGLVVGRSLRWLPYFTCFVLFNYAAMVRVLLGHRDPRQRNSSGGLTGDALSLAAARTVPMAVGFVFWIAAARIYPADGVGVAAAAVSTALLCSLFAALGQGNATITTAGRHPELLWPVVTRALLIVSLGALTAALGALAILQAIGGHLATELRDPASATLFAGVCLGATLALYLDQVAIARHRARHTLRRAALQSVTALAVLLTLRSDAPTAVFLAWNAGLWVSVLFGLADLRSIERTRGVAAPRGMVRDGLAHHAVTITDRAPALFLPVLVTELGSPQLGAHWYVALMIAMAAWYIPNSAAQALQNELARGSTSVHNGVRTALLAGAVTAVAAAALSWPVLRSFGPDYATAWPALLLLLAAVLPQTITQLALATDRVSGRFRAATSALGAAGAAAIMAGAVALHTGGLSSLAGSWLLVQMALACYGWQRIRCYLTEPAPSAPTRPTAPGSRS